MRWIHLSDLHIGEADEGQKVALDSLAGAIDQYTDSKEVDVVFITGDITYSGKVAEYQKFKDIVLQPLKRTKTCANSKIIIIPGNHDVDCSIGAPLSWDTIGVKRQEKFFYDDEEGRNIRIGVSQRFKSFVEFVGSEDIIGLNVLEKPADIIELVSKDNKLHVILLNTAFFSDIQVKDEKKSPAPVHAINYCLKGKETNPPVLILGHHPSSHFIPSTKDQFDTVLHEKNAIYLHGHLHRITPSFSNKGLTEFGFGSGYESALHKQPHPPYRNAFAICELDDSLHIAPIQWNSEHGFWTNKESLPKCFEEESIILDYGYRFNIGTSKISNGRGSFIKHAINKPKIDGCIWLDAKQDKVWNWLLPSLKIIEDVKKVDLLTATVPAGHVQLRITDELGGTHLLRAVAAHGDKISYQQVEQTNTLFDREKFESCVIITLGSVSDDARVLANQLKTRKQIQVIDGVEVGDLLLKHIFHDHVPLLENIDNNGCSIKFLISDDDIHILIVEKITQEWFCVLNSEGGFLDESSKIVDRVRKNQPHLSSIKYFRDGLRYAQESEEEHKKFTLENFFQESHTYFNKVRYAPLAAVGIRLSDTTLENLYVPSSANIGDASRIDESLGQFLVDHVDSQNLDQKQREIMLSQLKSQYGIKGKAEVDAAASIYRKFNNLLILGDPGSGKTLFIQNEILSYCQGEEKKHSWYQNHIPIYVALAESAKLLDTENDLFIICSIVAARRGIYLPETTLRYYVSEGRAAFFFDGLDEIGLVSQRLKLLELLSVFMNLYTGLGNRFVLTSRPTAIRPVEVPSQFTTIQLKGLTDPEIELLAERVILSGHSQENSVLTDHDKQLVNSLIEDCKSNPSIYRMARNPLLLTLLVFIYINSGTPGAKRHLVYSQAIRTLVAVRHRQKKDKVPSESDLRKRLGAVGYAIYKNEIGQIPLRSEITKVLMDKIESKDINVKLSIEKANDFIQEVADSTGLLVVTPKIDLYQEEHVSFMHHSFLEYYAAQGLLDKNHGQEAVDLILTPKWQNIVSLMFGILGDKDDVSPLLNQLMIEKSDSEKITQTRLLMAIDCALESDVPPENIQKSLAEHVEKCLKFGAGKVTGEIREDIAERISLILTSSGSVYFNEMLLAGMKSDDLQILAAYVDLIGKIDGITEIDEKYISLFEIIFEKRETLTRCVCIEVLYRNQLFRTERALNLLSSSLDGRASFAERYAAIRLIAGIPQIANRYPDQVIQLLDDKNELIQSYAARSIISSKIYEQDKYSNRMLLEKAVVKWDRSTHSVDENISSRLTLDKKIIDSYIYSHSISEIILGLGYLQILKREENYIYEIIFYVLRHNESHEVLSTALNTLRICTDSLKLVTLSDVDYLTSLLTNSHRDVRLSVLLLLEAFPPNELIHEGVKNHISKIAEDGSNAYELSACVKVIMSQSKEDAELKNYLFEILENRIDRMNNYGFGAKEDQKDSIDLLIGCEKLKGMISTRLSEKLWIMVNNHKTPKDIRKYCLKMYCSSSIPKPNVFDNIIKYIGTPNIPFKTTVYGGCLSIIRNCSSKVDYISDCYSKLILLNQELSSRWQIEYQQILDTIDSLRMSHIRDSLIEIEKLVASHSEFKTKNN